MALIYVPQGCVGRIDAATKAVDVVGLTSDYFSVCVAVVIRNATRSSLLHFDILTSPGSIQREIDWVMEGNKDQGKRMASNEEEEMDLCAYYNKHGASWNVDTIRRHYGTQLKYREIVGAQTVENYKGRINLRFVTPGSAKRPAQAPAVDFLTDSVPIRYHPDALILTASKNACDLNKHLISAAGSGFPAPLVYESFAWYPVAPEARLPAEVRELVFGVPLHKGLWAFLDAMNDEVRKRLPHTYFPGMGAPQAEVLQHLTGPDRAHDNCLFLAPVAVLRAAANNYQGDSSRPAAAVASVLKDSLMLLGKSVEKCDATRLREAMDESHSNTPAHQDAAAEGNCNLRAILDNAGRVLVKDVEGSGECELRCRLSELESHFITGFFRSAHGNAPCQWQSIADLIAKQQQVSKDVREVQESAAEGTARGVQSFNLKKMEDAVTFFRTSLHLTLQSRLGCSEDVREAAYDYAATILQSETEDEDLLEESLLWLKRILAHESASINEGSRKRYHAKLEDAQARVEKIKGVRPWKVAKKTHHSDAP